MDTQPQISTVPGTRAPGREPAGLPSRTERPVGVVLAAIALLLLFPSSSAGESPRVIPTILNTSEGRWDGEGRRLKLVEELSIGLAEGDEGYVLGRVFDIAVTSGRRVLVLDNGFTRIRIYDSHGEYMGSIGQNGEGPGEFFFPTAITTDSDDNIYVASRGRVSKFDSAGVYLDEFRHGYPSGFVRSVRVAASRDLVLSCFDVLDQQIIHRYNQNGELLASFCSSYAVGEEIDVRVEDAFAGGAIDLAPDGTIAFTQMTPYEIRHFTPDGQLIRTIHRENDFMDEPPVEFHEGGGMTIGTPTMCYSILVLADGKILNTAKRPIDFEGAGTILDLFDEDGYLLTTTLLEDNITPKCVDRAGRLYAINYDDHPSITRYRVEY